MYIDSYLPLVSIVIPVYNGSNYLREAIDTALAQTYQNIEIIVVNDGSTDDGATEAIALSYGDRIRYFRKANGGSSSALNVGIANMRGEWFSWLSHDDLYLPEKIERQISALNSMDISRQERFKHVFFSDFMMIDADGNRIMKNDSAKADRISQKLINLPHNGYLIAEPTVNIYHGCSCLIPREVFDKVGCFDESLRLVNDLDLWFRIYAAGYCVHYIPEVLVKGRVHKAQVSKSVGYSYQNSEQDMYWRRSLEWLLENYPDDQKLFYLFGRNAYLKGRFAEGERAYAHIEEATAKTVMFRLVYKSRYLLRNLAKKVYLFVRQ